MNKIKKSLSSNKACLLLICLVLISLAVENNQSQQNLRKPSSLSSPTKEYTFKYEFKGDKLEIKVKNKEWDESLSQAAQQCFNYFKGDKKVSEEVGLDIIDVCANPR